MQLRRGAISRESEREGRRVAPQRVISRSLALISRERFNLIKRHRVRSARARPLFTSVTYLQRPIDAYRGDHVDYRSSMGKRDLLSGHFVAACLLTCLPRYPYRRKNIAYPARSESGDFLLLPCRVAPSRSGDITICLQRRSRKNVRVFLPPRLRGNVRTSRTWDRRRKNCPLALRLPRKRSRVYFDF